MALETPTIPHDVGAREATDDKALSELIGALKAQSYRFVTPTPATHARLLARSCGRSARDLRDIFGWNMPFPAHLVDDALLAQLRVAGHVEESEHGLRSRVRVSSLGPDLFVHSAFPTDSTDAVFFGPDSYRFAALIARELRRFPERPGARLVDIGTGAGVGAIAAARCCPAVEIVMTDINPAAIRFARLNAATAGVAAMFHVSADLSPVPGPLDLLLANPPYIVDPTGRAYRDGGGLHGAEVSLTMARAALPRLAAGGRFILYTGSAIVGGEDALHTRLAALAHDYGYALRYEEIDPDVFGEELETPGYRDVERIALVGAVFDRPRR